MSGYRNQKSTGKPALKGNLALKSSPLNPSCGKSVSQDLVIDHMNAHYKKLLNAKSAIDSSVPKTFTSSQKVRDRQVRDAIIANSKRSGSAKNLTNSRPSGIRPSSARANRPGSARSGAMKATYTPANLDPFTLDDVDYQNFTQDEINCINAMVNDTIDSERIDRMLNGEAGVPGEKLSARSGSSRGQRTSRGMAEAMSMNTLQRKTMSADILDKRTHVFTEPSKSFTPRTLQSSKYKDIPSKLSQTKHFRPAKKSLPPSSSKTNKGYAPSATESDILDETLMSRDFSTRLTMSGAVPKLDISIDQDHMRWLQEQSARHESKDYRPLQQELASQAPVPSTSARNGYTKQRIKKEEEELSYLDFIGEVTNDVLTRGIFTNRVLCNVFEEHIQKNKGRLDEDRMRSMLDNLREDLGISAHESYREDPEDVGMGSKRPKVRSSSKTTGYTGDSSQFRNIKAGSLSADRHGAGLHDGNHWTGTTDSRDYYDKNPALNKNQSANPMEAQSLTDIAEVSEKSPSVSSLVSKAASSKGSKASGKDTKAMDDALVDLLGLGDTKDLQANEDAVFSSKVGMETMSVKSELSSHPSEKVSTKASADPLANYAETLAQRDHSDKVSVHSAASKSSRTSALKDSAGSKPLPRQAAYSSSSRQTSVNSRKDSLADETTPTPSPRYSSKRSEASVDREVVSKQSPASSQRSTRSVYKSKQRGFPGSDSHNDGDTDDKAKSTSRQTSLEDEEGREDLESNIEFGKTTMFAKTKNLDMTYKALSQVSGDLENDSDNYSDKYSDEELAMLP